MVEGGFTLSNAIPIGETFHPQFCISFVIPQAIFSFFAAWGQPGWAVASSSSPTNEVSVPAVLAPRCRAAAPLSLLRNSFHSGPCGAAEGSEFSSPLGSCSLSQLKLWGMRWIEASVESLRATSSYLELPDQPEGVTTKREEWIFKDPQMGSAINIFQVI